MTYPQGRLSLRGGAAANDIGLDPPGILGPTSGGVPVPGTIQYFYDFRSESGLWVPIYPPPGLASLAWNASGQMTVNFPGPRNANPHAFLAGVKSRFNVFFDSNGEIQLYFKFDNVAYTPGAVGANESVGLICQDMTGDGIANTDEGHFFGQGLRWASGNTYIRIGGMEALAGVPDFAAWYTMRNLDLSIGHAITSAEHRCAISVSAVGRMVPTSYEYYDHTLSMWVPYAGAFGAVYTTGMEQMNGVNIILGIFPYTYEIFTARLVEFRIEKGFGSMGSRGGWIR